MKVGDGNTIQEIGIGIIIMQGKNGNKYVMKDVLFVPRLSCNLFSIRRCHKSKNSITFPAEDDKHMFITDKYGRRSLSTTLHEKLYILEMKQHIVNHAHVSEEIWHQRLGHASYDQINKITNLSKNFVLSKSRKKEFPCFGCSKGKLKKRSRKTFRLHPAKELLEVTHTDIDGPLDNRIYGYHFMITFLDEGSRRGKVYFIKHKSGALD